MLAYLLNALVVITLSNQVNTCVEDSDCIEGEVCSPPDNIIHLSHCMIGCKNNNQCKSENGCVFFHSGDLIGQCQCEEQSDCFDGEDCFDQTVYFEETNTEQNYTLCDIDDFNTTSVYNL